MSTRSLLDALKIPTPCPASWDRMTGDDRVRFCRECRLNVYTLSSMTRAEAEELLREKEGRVCVRYYERADGTVLTQPCPGALAAARRVVVRGAALLAGFVALLLALVDLGIVPAPLLRGSDERNLPLREIEPIRSIVDWLLPGTPGRWVAGEAPRLPPPPTVTIPALDDDEDLP
jgi:hypothetical protein